MKLTGLQVLHRSMRDQDMTRIRFRYTLNHLVFDCLFFAEGDPFQLVLGCLGHNFAIFVDVHQGYEIRPFIEPRETYDALCKALFKNARSGHPFSPKTFFEEFNRGIPTHAKPDQKPTPSDIIRHYPDIEEADKKWFCGWRDNTKQGDQVTPRNLAKTLRLLGPQAHELAQRRNLSTCWTHLEDKATAFYLPA